MYFYFENYLVNIISILLTITYNHQEVIVAENNMYGNTPAYMAKCSFHGQNEHGENIWQIW